MEKPLKRKSLRSLEASSNNESVASVKDDEAEMSRYRKRLEDEARGSARKSASSVSSEKAVPSILETFTKEQLNEHATSCLKLALENKINLKNAFDLQLIDYMAMMIKKKDSSIMTNFSIASTTLDASAKIYGCRVDSLFQNVVSIANSLSTAKNKRGDDDEEGGEGGEDGPDGGGGRKKKKNRPKRTVTSEHALGSINRKIIEKGPWNKFLIDYNDNTMLLNSGLQHENLGVTMSNNDKFFPTLESKKFETCSKCVKVPLPEILPNNTDLCPTFNKFSWDIEESAKTFTLENELEHAFDVNKSPEPIPDVDFDDDHFVSDMGGGDLGGGDDFDSEASEVVGVEKLTRAEKAFTVAKITDVTQLLTLDSKEYSYFDDKLLELWAGPSHWKIKKINSKKRADDEKKARHEKLKQKKEFRVEFNKNLKIAAKFKPPLDPLSTIVNRKTVSQWKTSKVTYFEDCHADPSDYLRFIVHKRLCIDFKTVMKQSGLLNESSRMPTTSSDFIDRLEDRDEFAISSPPREEVHDEFAPLNMSDDMNDNVDDGAPDDYYEDVGPVVNPDEPQPNDETGSMASYMANEYTSGAFIGDNLLPMPNKVNKIDLRIDTRRKIIDMKLIKKTILKILNFENGNEEMKFADMYKELLRRMPKNMTQDVTCPVVFFATLILCNEKNLCMKGHSTMEIVIRKAEPLQPIVQPSITE